MGRIIDAETAQVYAVLSYEKALLFAQNTTRSEGRDMRKTPLFMRNHRWQEICEKSCEVNADGVGL